LREAVIIESYLDEIGNDYGRDVSSAVKKNVSNYVHNHLAEFANKKKSGISKEYYNRLQEHIKTTPAMQDMMARYHVKTPSELDPSLMKDSDLSELVNKTVADFILNEDHNETALAKSAKYFGPIFEKYYDWNAVQAYRVSSPKAMEQARKDAKSLFTEYGLDEREVAETFDDYDNKSDITKQNHFNKIKRFVSALEGKVTDEDDLDLMDYILATHNPKNNMSKSNRGYKNVLFSSLENTTPYKRADNPYYKYNPIDILKSILFTNPQYREQMLREAEKNADKTG
jgi:hypothetical protein